MTSQGIQAFDLKILDTFPQAQRLKSVLFKKCRVYLFISLHFLNELGLMAFIPCKLTLC